MKNKHNNKNRIIILIIISLIILLIVSMQSRAKLSIRKEYWPYNNTIKENKYFTFFTNKVATCKLIINKKLIKTEESPLMSHTFLIRIKDLKKSIKNTAINQIVVNCTSGNENTIIKKKLIYQPTITKKTPIVENNNGNNIIKLIFSPINTIAIVLIILIIMIYIYLVYKNKENNENKKTDKGSFFFKKKTIKKTSKKSGLSEYIFNYPNNKKTNNNLKLKERINERNSIFSIFEKDLIDNINKGKINKEQINRFINQLGLNNEIWLNIEQLKKYLINSDRFWDVFTRIKIISREKLKNWNLKEQIKTIKRIVFARRLVNELNKIVQIINISNNNEIKEDKYKEISYNISLNSINKEALFNNNRRVNINSNEEAVSKTIIKLINEVYTINDFDLEFILIILNSLVKNKIISLNNLKDIVQFLLTKDYITNGEAISIMTNQIKK